MGDLENKKPACLLRRVSKYFYITYIIPTSPDSQYENDDDVTEFCSFLLNPGQMYTGILILQNKFQVNIFFTIKYHTYS